MIRSKTSFSMATVAAILYLGATVQAQIKVLPFHATSAEGNSACYYPFLYDASRSQVIWEGRAVSPIVAVVKSIHFRRDATNSNYPALSVANHVARIGHTTVTPAAMSTTYATNLTSAMTTIVNGKFSVVALPAPKPTPAPFAINYPLAAPFIFTTTKGNVILDWTTGTGATTAKKNYQLDAVTTASSGNTGFVTPFGTWGAFGGKDAASWKGDASKLVPGGSANFAFSGFKKAYTANLILGISNQTYSGLSLPFALGVIGAPGNTLYVSMDAILPFTLKQSGSNYIANLSYSIPKDPKLVGLSAFVQSYYADSTANGAGLVTSNAMQLTIGTAGPIGNMVAGQDANSTIGQVMNFLPVIQLK
jgi:hypothetical protein